MKRHTGAPRAVLDQDILESLLQAQSPILPPPERARALRERVLERVRPGEPRHEAPEQSAHLTIRGEAGDWVPLLPGVAMKLLREDETSRSYLLRMAPGARLPAHGHSMDEECMVLEGDVWLGDVCARAGDYHLARSGLPHGEVRTDGGCLLFLRGQKHYRHAGAG